MARTKSAQKMIRVAERRRRYTRPVRTAARTYVSSARELIRMGQLEEAKEAVRLAQEALDKAAQKGVIHKNNAARRKSRIVKMLKAALAASSPSPSSGKKA